jgi:hypothetical protein
VIRTQIQLTDSQAKILHELALKQGVSVAELIRRSVDYYILNSDVAAQQDLIERAKAAAGKYKSGVTDLAKNHDRYLAEDFR